MAQVLSPSAVVIPIEADDVGEEHGVEAAALERAREVDPEVELVEAQLLGVRMPPQAVLDVRDGVHHECGVAQRRAVGHGSSSWSAAGAARAQ